MSPGPAERARNGAATPPALALDDLSKTFGGQRALDRAHLTVEPGEVHGLLGQNGSGKSTLIKVLAGFHVPDAGSRLQIGGTAVPLPLPPGAARRLGLTFVHQHLGLIPTLSVLDNMMIGRLAARDMLAIDWRGERRRCAESLARYGVPLDVRAPVSSLPPVERALLAIVRAVEELRDAEGGHGVLVLDEPTPFLPRRDVERLFAVVRRVVARGSSVIFVSHDVDEVMEITDRCTILRDGRVAGTLTTRGTGKAEFIERIVGRKFERLHRAADPAVTAQATIAVDGLTGYSVADMSLRLRPGEVVGLTGLVGSGYAEVPYLLYGARPATAGSLHGLRGRLDLPAMTPTRAIASGIVLIPGDRANTSAIGTLPITDNMTMPVLGTVFRAFALARGAMARRVLELCRQYEIMPARPDLPLSALSGGNQQKVILAKWLQTGPSLVLLDEPTQGVDVGAREAVFAQIAQATAKGATVLCASSDYEQLEQICDRVLIFARGRIVAELARPAISKAAIAEQCYAHSERDPEQEIAA